MRIAIDTETYKMNEASGMLEPVLDTREFKLGCTITDKGQTNFFTKPDDMYNYLMRTIEKNKEKRRRTYIYAHNMEYDYYATAKNFLFDKDIKYISFTPFIAIQKENAYWLDTMSFYRCSLEEVGKSLGLPKLEMPEEITNVMQLRPYLQRDTEIVMKAMDNIQDNLGKMGYRPRKLLTAGQTAMTAFLTYVRKENKSMGLMEYNQKAKCKQVIKPKEPDLVRRAFRGARVEAIKTGDFKDVTYIDMNAMYPYVMRNMRFPNLNSERMINPITPKTLRDIAGNTIGVAQCTLEAPSGGIGYLPVRYMYKTMFPTSVQLRGTWTLLEIGRALSLGYKIKAAEWAVIYRENTINPFEDYMGELYDLRMSQEGEEARTTKLLMNELYAKFAQKKVNKDYLKVHRAKASELVSNGYKVETVKGNEYILSKELDPYIPSYVNPIIPALVTAEARDLMYENIVKVPMEELIYTDTDSLIFTGDYKSEFTIGKKMGQFKVEKEGVDCKVLGEKRYYIGEETKISGVPKKQRKKEIIINEENVKINRMRGMRECMKYGNLAMVGSFREVEMEMKPHSKRETVLPYYINEVKIWD